MALRPRIRHRLVAVVAFTSWSERPLKGTVADLGRLQDGMIRRALSAR